MHNFTVFRTNFLVNLQKLAFLVEILEMRDARFSASVKKKLKNKLN